MLTSEENNANQSGIAEAHELVKPHVKDALVILSDDDPSNDALGYLHLANAFVAISDDVNTLAVCQSIRPMKNGVAVLASDPKESDAKSAADSEEETEESDTEGQIHDAEAEADKDEGQDEEEGDDEDEDEDEDEDDDDEPDDFWACDGVCVRSFNNFDNSIICRMGCAYFCQSCYALFLEDKIPFRVCSKAHGHIEIPALETRFKEGELVVDGTVMTLDDWKKSIKKSWGL